MKILIILGIVGLLIAGGLYLYNLNNSKEEPIEEKIFQGPVPEGYDLEHFRKTGETKPLEIEQ